MADRHRQERERFDQGRSRPLRNASPRTGDDVRGYSPDRVFPRSSSGLEATEYDRQTYGGPYGAQRIGAREWTSSEGWRVPGPHAGRGPRGYQRADDRILEELNDRLTAHGLIDATEIDTRVERGEVTLEGFVDSREVKRAAEDVAEDIPGVRDVHNRIRLRSHAEGDGVGRTSVLGLTESRSQTTSRSAARRSRTRS